MDDCFRTNLEPVKWEFSVHETESENNWMYSRQRRRMLAHLQPIPDDPNGPLPTYFEVEVPDGVEKVHVTECDPLVEYDPNFMMDLKFFEEEVYCAKSA